MFGWQKTLGSFGLDDRAVSRGWLRQELEFRAIRSQETRLFELHRGERGRIFQLRNFDKGTLKVRMRVTRAIRVPKPKGERFGARVLSTMVFNGPQKYAYPLDSVENNGHVRVGVKWQAGPRGLI